jgi:tetratricopeptide (TPR) repeat protein
MNEFKVPIASQIRDAQTPAEELRETLGRLESHVGKLHLSEKDELIETLVLFDHADELFLTLSERGADLAPERTRFSTVSEQFKRKSKLFLKRLGGAEELQRLRAEREPPEDNWWWFVDRALAAERNARLRRTLTSAALTAVIIGALTALYMLFLAPDEATRERYKYEQRAERALTEGNAQVALENVETALTYAPDEPELLTLKGVTHQALDQPEQAEAAFETAREGYDDPITFLSARAQVYMRANMPAAAYDDAQAILEIDSTSAVGHFQLGSANTALGNLSEATVNYETAAELAREQDNVELEGMARVQLANLMMMMMVPQQATPAPTPES